MNNPVGRSTAAEFQRLAAMRGVSSLIEWDDEKRSYFATRVRGDGTPGERTRCGESVHGLFAWLNKIPGVLP